MVRPFVGGQPNKDRFGSEDLVTDSRSGFVIRQVREELERRKLDNEQPARGGRVNGCEVQAPQAHLSVPICLRIPRLAANETTTKDVPGIQSQVRLFI
jgi:hypothetical protein